jgi:tetratricopeptide (TPR) repeat protein
MVNGRWIGLPVAFAAFVAGTLPLVTSAPSLAAPPEAEHAAAVESFRRGTQLVEAGQLQGAIDAFREALQHEPASVGARLDLADCYEKIGSPASAWREYAIAEAHARETGDPRQEMARSSGAHLESSLLVLALTVHGQPVEGMDLRVDGDPVVREILRRGVIAVAPGRHRVDLSAPGKRPLSQDVAGGAGEKHGLTISFEAESAAPTDEPTRPASSAQKNWGIAIGSLGLAAVALGSATGAIAVADKSNLQRESTDSTVGAPRFYADRSSADTFANISTATLVAGGIVLAAGVSVYLSAPSSSGRTLRATIAPGVGGSSAVVLAGTF